MPDTLDDIERNIETDRGMLARTLDQLSEAISPERISGSVAREVEARGGAAAATAIDMARANPAGAILLGLGVAALLAGPKRPAPASNPARASGQSGRDTLTPEFDARVAAASAPPPEPKAPRLRAALNSGLANLPEPARRRVLAARRKAIEAQEEIDRRTSAAARRARSLHQRQPLATGALAMGFGALIGGLLPRTEVEDAWLGERRDALVEQAELALRDEIARATSTGEAALRESVDAGLERLRQ